MLGRNIMLNWKERFNLKLDAQKDETEGGGTGDQGQKPEGDQKPEDKKDESTDGDKLDVEKLPENVKAYIKSLRDENAKHRTKNKDLGSKNEKVMKALVEAGIIEPSDEEAPEEKLKSVSSKAQALELRAAMLETAVEYNIPKDSLDYFEFLLQKALDGLEDGEELTEEQVAELAKKVKGNTQHTGTKSTSVSGNKSGAGAPPPGGDKSAVTLDQFTRMNMGEKSSLYQKSPETYNQLVAEAKAKKVLV